MVCFRNIIVNTLYDDDDDDNKQQLHHQQWRKELGWGYSVTWQVTPAVKVHPVPMASQIAATTRDSSWTSMLKSPKLSLYLRFPNQNFIRISRFPHVRYKPVPVIYLVSPSRCRNWGSVFWKVIFPDNLQTTDSITSLSPISKFPMTAILVQFITKLCLLYQDCNISGGTMFIKAFNKRNRPVNIYISVAWSPIQEQAKQSCTLIVYENRSLSQLTL